jgi:branched-chain amino acid transport system substrate-binding protein
MKLERKGGRRRLGALIGLVTLALGTAACGETSGAGGSESADDPIPIGAILPITGTLSYYGTEYQRGMELAQKEINSNGGINGRDVKFTFLDDGGNTTTALNGVRSLKAKGTKIVTGTGSSTTDLAVSQLADQLGLSSWMLGTSSELTERKLKHIVAPSVATPNFVKAAFEIFKEVPEILDKPMNEITVALVHSNDAYGTANAQAEEPVLKEYGAKIVLDVSYDIASTDYSSTISKLKAADPDVVVQTGYTDDVVLMWKQAKSAQYTPDFMIGSGGTGTLNFVKALGSYANGFASYGYALPSEKQEASIAFKEAYREAYGADLTSGHALMVYSSMLRLADVLTEADTDDPEAVTEAAHAMDKPAGTYPDGCGFKLTEGGMNDMCTAGGFQWQDQKLAPVYPEALATAELLGPLPLE